jgi:1-acyl-sn-glycerol-3-phosphate acyltransferase
MQTLMHNLRGVLAMLLFSLNAVLWCGLLFIAALVRPLLPGLERKVAYGARLHPLVDRWVAGNLAIIRGLRLARLNVVGAEALRRDGWYLVLCNHQSWIDIIALQCGLLHDAPVLKFFTKQQLIWLPFIGLSCWVLDFPLMRRFSADALAANPALRRVDLETTRAACDRFRHAPTTVLNFTEGTRFTRAKHAQQGSPYANLLKPRAGGVGSVLATLGDRLDAIVDATITYPTVLADGTRHNEPPSFWHFLCGYVPEIRLELRAHPVASELIGGDYAEDDAYRTRVRNWLDALWSEKDARLARAQDGVGVA